jgi:DNA-binding LacI/PurR family transcriptional regulator
MIKARDVADELGLSISTIGRALADDPRISDETKASVRRVAERLGYVGNSAAQIMRGRSSNMIGLMIPDVENYFYAAIAQAMSDCLDRHGYRLLLSLTQDDPDVELRHIKELAGARASGIIIVPTAKPRRESRNLLASVPHVQFLRRVSTLGAAWFGIDDEAAIRTATAHLVGLGHTRIGYLGGAAALSTGAARVAGFRAALRAHGLEPAPGLERLGEPTSPFGEAACAELLATSSPPTAIMTGSVHITEGVIAQLERARIRVPQALSVIGFGSAPWFAWWRGGLTAVSPPVPVLARSCALWFLDQLNSKRDTAPAAHEAATGSAFIIRQTTAALKGSRHR